MKKIYFAVVVTTAIVQTIYADYLNDSRDFKDSEVEVRKKPDVGAFEAKKRRIL
jgi:hypothetical protein